MDPNNPDFVIQPAKDGHGSKEGIRGDIQPHTMGQPQHTITLTLTSPASGQGPNMVHGQGPSSGGQGGASLIVSGIPSMGQGIGLSAATTAGQHGPHGQVSMHYSGSPISATPIQGGLQAKGGPQNYIMAGGPGGQPLIVSGATVLPSAAPGLTGLSAVSSGPNAPASHTQGHYAGPAITSTPIQQGMSSKGPSQNYVMAGGTMQASNNVGGPDSGDEGLPVSIHVSNNPMGPGHDSGPNSNASSDSHQSGQERLKVEDALNYLDQVKYKFGNQPQVYNDFLDIMKEFKSQSIDTPGVISRVSNLFRGHPELIVGFNTFLPPGYKIEVQTHDNGSQISYRVDGVTNYVVTNMPTVLPSTVPPSHPPIQQPQISTPQIIQHTTPGVPIRTVVTHTPHPAPSVQTYGGNTGNIGPPLGNPTPIGVSNGRSVSPVPPSPSNLVPASNNYETVAPSTFTHSFSSPFVQNAFPSLQTQPVEFNHAINYVNKIKNRFSGQPEKYKQFLEILHTYQKEQRNQKDGLPATSMFLTEHEVFAQVSKLFENQEDLLQEFGQFLPDSPSQIGVEIKPIVVEPQKKTVKAPARDYNPPPAPAPAARPVNQQTAPKRPTVVAPHPITKKPKLSAPYKDVSFAEAARFGTLHDYSFFDKVKSVFKNQEVFDNFLRCLVLFNEEVISRQELVTIVTPFFNKAPELLSWFKDFVISNREEGVPLYEPLSQHLLKHDKITEEQALEIDFSTCKRLGASYCALPKNHVPPICSGRTALCKEVLNDVWVSFPTWSEDSTFVTSRKTQYEEYICRCEDERFELDVVIEANALTIKTFEGVARKMAFMSPEELSVFELDDTLGSNSSTTIHQRTVKRLYGDKAGELIDGLKKTPFVAIPIVLKRLKNKEEEWREAQRTFNKVWSEQVERFYLKSLDHQGLTFKQSDIRALRSKALVNEIETIFDERHEQLESQAPGAAADNSPHLALHYRERTVLDDACNLLLHHVRRQSGIQKDDKRKIKQLLKHFIPDLFNHTRMELSDDENDDGSPDEHDDHRKTPTDYGTRNGNKRACNKRGNGKARKDEEEASNQASGSSGNGGREESRRTMAKRELKLSQAEGARMLKHSGQHGKDGRPIVTDFSDALGGSDGSDQQQGGSDAEIKEGDIGNPSRIIQLPHPDQDESYTLLYVNNAWYVFLRLHQILCERLTRILETSTKLLAGETPELRDYVINSPAVALRMRPISEVELEDYYPTFLEMVRNLLDGVIDAGTYEDSLREMFGIHAYIAFTMDKVVANAVRQLQTLVSDEICHKALDLFHLAHKNGGTGGLCATSRQRHQAEVAYQMQAEQAFADENTVRVTIYHRSCRMLMHLLESDKVQDSNEGKAKWSNYIATYVKSDITGTDLQVKDKVRPVYLKRNISKWKKARMEAYSQYPMSMARSLMEPGSQDDAPGPSIPMPGRHSPDKDDPVTIELKATKSQRLPQLERMDGKQPKYIRSNLDPVTPAEAEALEKQLSRNAERRANPNAVPEEEQMDDSEAKSTVKPVTPEEAEQLERQLEMNAKRRADRSDSAVPASFPYIMKENLQLSFHPHSYKLMFIVNSENYFYLKGALKRAKQIHKKVTKRLNDEFGRWHQSWLERNVTEDQITKCEDWFVSTKISDTKVVCKNDINLTPYRPFNRYVVKKSKH